MTRFPLDHRHAVYLASLPLLVGCYTTRPLPDPTGAPSGAPLQVTLTARGTEELTSVVGPQVARLEGTLLRASRDTLELSLRRSVRQDAREDPWQGQRVALPSAYVSGVATQTLSRSRSWLTAGAIVVGAVLLAAIGRGIGIGGEDTGGTSAGQ